MRRYKAKDVKTRCYQQGVGQFEPRFQGKGSSLGNIFGFYKTRQILLSNSANCIVIRAVVLTQYRRVTDGQTDRCNCHSLYSACNASVAAHCKNRWNLLGCRKLANRSQSSVGRSSPFCEDCTSYGNSVCLSHAGIVSKRLHVALCCLHYQIAKCV